MRNVTNTSTSQFRVFDLYIVGLSDREIAFNFKQIKLQTFSGKQMFCPSGGCHINGILPRRIF